MTHSQAVGISTGFAIFGSAVFLYVLFYIPPQISGGQPNNPAVSAFILSAALAISGLAALFVRLVHHRRALVTGEEERRTSRQPIVALRQGAWVALGVGIVLTLAYFDILDYAYFFATIVTLVLVEIFIQYRQ